MALTDKEKFIAEFFARNEVIEYKDGKPFYTCPYAYCEAFRDGGFCPMWRCNGNELYVEKAMDYFGLWSKDHLNDSHLEEWFYKSTNYDDCIVPCVVEDKKSCWFIAAEHAWEARGKPMKKFRVKLVFEVSTADYDLEAKDYEEAHEQAVNKFIVENLSFSEIQSSANSGQK